MGKKRFLSRSRFGGGVGAAAGAVVIDCDAGHSEPEPAKPEEKTFLEKLVSVLQTLTLFIVILVGALAISYAIIFQVFRAGQSYNESNFLSQNAARMNSDTSIVLADGVVRDWTEQTRQIHVIDRKAGSVFMSDSVVGDPSDHILLGLYERDGTKRKLEAALHFYLAASNGHPDAVRLYRSLNVPPEDHQRLYQDFISLHELNGDVGLLRLGQHYLGADAFRIADRMREKLRFDEPNDYLWPQDTDAANLAYRYFQMASICGLRSAYDWRAETANFYKFTEQRESALKQQSKGQLDQLVRSFGGDQDAYCDRARLIDAIAVVRDHHRSRAVVRFEDELSGWNGADNPCDSEATRFTDEECDEFDAVIRRGVFGPSANLPTFKEMIDAVALANASPRRFLDRYVSRGAPDARGDRAVPGRNARGGGATGSQAYRNAPGASAYANIATRAADGAPVDCDALADPPGECAEREPALACSDLAQYHFKRGEADMAIGRISRARANFNRALAVGRSCQSEFGELAAKRLAALNLTCEYSVESLARIARDYDNNAGGGALIDLPARQRALAAKGYYEGEIDGRYGPGTRASVRLFQREIGFSETGDLTPIETVYLICSAAQVNADAASINLLGVMYIAGLGVVQNTDAGVRFLKQAAQRGDADAKLNLALVYGTGTVAASYRLCDLVENIEQADAYLVEAANAGERRAQQLISAYGALTPSERWARIRDDLKLNDFYKTRLEQVGEACRPNPASPDAAGAGATQ